MPVQGDIQLGQLEWGEAGEAVTPASNEGSAEDTCTELTIRVTNADGQQSFTCARTTPTLVDRADGGDGPITFAFDMTYGDDIPLDRFAHVDVSDEDGQIQTGFINNRSLPDLAGYEGQAKYIALGYGSALGRRRFNASTKIGPLWPNVPSQSLDGTEIPNVTPIATTAHAAVDYAVASLGGGHVYPHDVGFGPDLLQTQEYLGRSAQDVVNDMSALSLWLSTPFKFQVHGWQLTWRAVDLAARYQVDVKRCTAMATDDCGKLYNHVIIIWGKYQTAEWPEVLDYRDIPDQVDLCVNAANEIHDYATALSLAQGLYSRIREMELGWSVTLTVPHETAIEEMGVGPIENGYRCRAAKGIRLVNLPTGLGRNPVPERMFVHERTWDGPGGGNTTLILGDPRDQAAAIRQTMHAAGGSRMIISMAQPGLSTPVRNLYDTMVGPPLPLAASISVGSGGGSTALPPPQDHGVPLVDTKQDTVAPEALPPQPPAVPFQINDADTTGKKGASFIQPMRITHYSLVASKACTVTINVYRGDGTLILTLKLEASASKIDQAITHVESPLVHEDTPPTYLDIVDKDTLVYEVSVADAVNMAPESNGSANWVSIGLYSHRYYPNYSGNVAPITGAVTS